MKKFFVIAIALVGFVSCNSNNNCANDTDTVVNDTVAVDTVAVDTIA